MRRSVRWLALMAVLAAQAAGGQELPTWRLQEVRRIGSLDGPDALTGMVDVAVAPDGRIFVTQPRDGEVKVFGPDGVLIQRLGRPGDGPGEFRRPGRIGWIGDSLYVLDGATRRVTFFDDHGGLLGTVPSATPQVGLVFTSTVPRRLHQGGDAVAVPNRFAQAMTGNPSLAQPILRTTWGGAVLDTLELLTLAHSTRIVTAGGTVYFGGQPFADNPIYDVAPDGSWVVIVDRTVSSAGSALYRVRRISVAGAVEEEGARWGDPLPLTAAQQDSTLEALTEATGSPFGTRSMARKLRAALFVPAYWPPATDVVIGVDGKVWVRREEVAGELWDILSPNLIPIAQVRAPKTFRLHISDGRTVWGSVRDDLGVSYLVQYEVAR